VVVIEDLFGSGYVIILINISLLVSMPSRFIYQDDNDFEFHQLSKRFQLSRWIHKRNPALCDYRLQFRPLPSTSALCAYGRSKDDGHQTNPFKYG